MERSWWIKVSSLVEDMVRSAATNQKIVQNLQNSVWKMQKGICRMAKIYEALNYTFSKLNDPNFTEYIKVFSSSHLPAFATLTLAFLRGSVRELHGGRSFAMEDKNINAGY